MISDHPESIITNIKLLLSLQVLPKKETNLFNINSKVVIIFSIIVKLLMISKIIKTKIKPNNKPIPLIMNLSKSV